MAVDGTGVNENVLPALPVSSVRTGVPARGVGMRHAFLHVTNALRARAVGGLSHPRFCILFCFVSLRAPPASSS